MAMPLQLERLTLRELLLPLKEPFRISSGTQTSRRILLLELEDAEGASVVVRVRGAGGAELQRRKRSTPPGSPLEHWVAPRVLGRTFAEPAEVFPALQHNFRGH